MEKKSKTVRVTTGRFRVQRRVYPTNQKIHMIRILVLRDITKIWKKSTILKMSKVINKLPKKNFSHKWSGDLSFFISNEFICFSESVRIYSVFSKSSKIFLKISKIEYNVTNFEYVVVKKFHITKDNFRIIKLTVAQLWLQFIVKNRIFMNIKKNWKNSYRFWKINKFIWNGQRIRYLKTIKKYNYNIFIIKI